MMTMVMMMVEIILKMTMMMLGIILKNGCNKRLGLCASVQEIGIWQLKSSYERGYDDNDDDDDDDDEVDNDDDDDHDHDHDDHDENYDLKPCSYSWRVL